MLDDLRNHAATPSSEEQSWMGTNPVAIVARAFALAVVAIAIGISVSHLLANESAFSAGIVVATP
jgi:hypothetical protein